MTTGQLLAEASQTAPLAKRDLRFLLAELLQCNLLEVELFPERELTESQLSRIRQDLVRLEHQEPPQYILGKAWFYGLELDVSPAVLIPRCETEGLVELALAYLQDGMAVLDIGTGSGAIAITLRSKMPGLKVVATDTSSAALAIARGNADKHTCLVDFQEADLFPAGADKFHLIVSNPPYICTEDYAELEARVREFEPQAALLAAEDGLAYYRRILDGAPKYLHAGAMLLFEHGDTQRESIIALALARGYKPFLVKDDLCGRARYLGFKYIQV